MTIHDHPIFVVLVVAVAAPLLAEIRVGARIPVVVLEVLLGMLVGPHLLALLHPDLFFEYMKILGMAAMMFMAGMEMDFAKIRGRPLGLAAGGWTASLAIALVVVGVLDVIPGANAPIMVAIALSTTSLGVLLPILRDGGQLETQFGRMVMASGTVGEIAPIIAVSLALSTRFSTWQEFGMLLFFLGLVAMAAAVGTGARPPRLLAFLGKTMHSSTQLPVRLSVLVMAAFLTLAYVMGFEPILGAFAAGLIVGLATKGPQGEDLRVKIDAVFFGWFTPFFFIGTGMDLDLGALLRETSTMILTPVFLLLFLLARGLPVFLYRRDIPGPQLLPFALSSSVAALGLVVVITEIGLQAKVMNPEIAQALIGAALLSLLVFPTLAGALLARSAPRN